MQPQLRIYHSYQAGATLILQVVHLREGVNPS